MFLSFQRTCSYLLVISPALRRWCDIEDSLFCQTTGSWRWGLWDRGGLGNTVPCWSFCSTRCCLLYSPVMLETRINHDYSSLIQVRTHTRTHWHSKTKFDVHFHWESQKAAETLIVTVFAVAVWNLQVNLLSKVFNEER